MRRRELITLIGGGSLLVIGCASAAGGQAAHHRVPRRGCFSAFVARLRELDWIEGRTIAIEYRWSQGRSERYAEIAAEFVRLNVDVIVTVGSAVPIVRQATAVIPIIFAVASDPVGSGLVASLAQPGGNVTGLSIQANVDALTRIRSNGKHLRGLIIDFSGCGP
jgi:putative tryptophan/tyrosine transport system substrate-binding protein